MRFLPMLMVILMVSGCGGTLVLESRNNPPREAPRASYPVHEVSADEAASIALAETSRRQGCRFDVREIQQTGNRWKVELRGWDHRDRRVTVRVDVDRVTGEVLRYASKTKKHDHDDDDHGRGRGHDDEHH